MSRQADFQILKNELESLKAQTTLLTVQIDHGAMGGTNSMLNITAPKEVVKWLVTWLNTEPMVAINKSKALCKIEVEKARLEAVTEAQAFQNANNAVIN